MSSDWPKVKLVDYCDKIGSGATPRGGSKVYLDSGEIALVRSQNVYNHGFEYDGLVYIDEEAAEKLSNVELEENDILINITGDSVARVCMVPDDVLPARVNQHVSILRPKNGSLDPRFLRYSLVNYENQYKLLAIASAGGTRKAITKGHLEEFEISLPDITYQKEVSEILSTFDQKIHLNQQTKETLETMAQAIFKSWFVDFDPVRAKMKAKEDGRDPNHAAMAAIAGISLEHDWDEVEAALKLKLERMCVEHREQLEKTAGLFPETMEESEIGEVPKGWGISRLEDYITLSYGKGLRKKDRKEGKIPVYGSGGLTGTHDESLIEGPGIIVGRKGTVGSIYWEDRDFWPIDTVFYVEPKNKVDLSFYYYLLYTLGLDEMNTDAAVPGLNRNNAYRLQIPEFPEKLMKQFADFTSDLHKMMRVKKAEKKTLENLRDTLLLKLISGELEL